MSVEGLRYEFFLDPTGFWLVWDRLTDQPASFGQQALMGLSRGEAESACRLMNKLHDRLSRRTAKAAA
ncbi:hypothetical protein [Chelativorans sp. AA-79]|uniref:hypothetical protein n=1 Tax=Chelativorans sp. AA-79 TaxID=3028735 RepID=UPI0023F65D9A|nr:hypothetical protein [Chelativorans sp. AA-79]WEX09321.1 hypothetical protein PVE73_25435 [Chelativorans sp. AA-79]